MGWPYHFIDLNDAQKHERRQLLDYYGALAQVSVLLPLLVLQAYFAVQSARRKRADQARSEAPNSPHVKAQRGRQQAGLRKVSQVFNKLAWWCDDACEVGGERLGTKGEVVGAAVWLAWLLVLSVVQTGNDYLHLTKRFGIVGVSQLPFHYLLAMKTPYSPLQMLTRSSHETLNSVHQLLGRVVTILLYLHAGFYLNFYIAKDLLGSKIKEFYVICGIFSIIAFTVVGTTALGPVRRWSYRVFYTVHVVLATLLLPVLYFHADHLRVYIYETALVYILSAIMRVLTTQHLEGTIKRIPNTNLLELDLTLTRTHKLLRSWQPGQHAYISLASHPMLRTFRSNPFTVASIPEIDGRLRFVARILDGNTTKLASSADKAFQHLTIEGPYGLATHADRLLRYDRVLFVAGGVGATFILPLYRQLLADLSPSKGSYRRQKVNFVWTVRSKAEMQWALPEDEEQRDGFVERLNVCITGAGGDLNGTVGGSFSIGAENDGATDEDGIELEEQKNLLSRDKRDPHDSPDGIPTFAGRPDLGRLVDQTFSHGNSHEKVAIVVCGPTSLSRALRREAGRWIQRGREIWFWEESFAF